MCVKPKFIITLNHFYENRQTTYALEYEPEKMKQNWCWNNCSEFMWNKIIAQNKDVQPLRKACAVDCWESRALWHTAVAEFPEMVLLLP